MGYDIATTAKNKGRRIPAIARLSDTGLQGGDYSKALRMLEAGLPFTYSDGTRQIALTAA